MARAWRSVRALIAHLQEMHGHFHPTVADERTVVNLQTDVDKLTADYHHGKELFVSQACYACHRISGFARGGVGPDLTNEGNAYPWYVKQKISWPQSDLKTSTMPNYRLDHEELEDLVTFVLGQRTGKKISDMEYKQLVEDWEAGRRKQSWEQPVTQPKFTMCATV